MWERPAGIAVSVTGHRLVSHTKDWCGPAGWCMLVSLRRLGRV
ncbi:hypothetical protein QH494_01900 [Sphingomonas sp. AR_OL41]|nr:hypothetical protein [Sphingomonas sp. AR_OL41]MDH7970921.1 hypothetical protein [Sphingomonas sp. AR_OL41]